MLMTNFNLSAQAFNDIEVKQIWVGAYNSGAEAAVRVFTSAGTFVNTNIACDRSDAFVIVSGVLNSAGGVIPGNIYFDQQYSMLLAAKYSGDTVDAWISGCTEDGKFPRAARLSIK